MLGLPDGIKGLLFDLDGVITKTAVVHAQAWKQTFDGFLRERDGDDFTPFDPHADYDRYVDGLPRTAGVRGFLQSRGIELPEGDPDDPPGTPTLAGLGNRKNDLVLELIHTEGVEAYPGSVRYLDAVRTAGLPCAVVSSSANTRDVLQTTGLLDRFQVIVDGVVARERGLEGKPAPDTFLEGAKDLGVDRSAAVVFEDAQSGVRAGHAGGFGQVVGVDRVGQADALRREGADVVVQDLAELLDEDPA